jgi:hypothetical protein
MPSDFEHLLSSTVVREPQTLWDLDDGIIAMHWIADALSQIFGNTIDKGYVHRDKDSRGEYIELFVNNNILKEYKPVDGDEVDTLSVNRFVVLIDSAENVGIGRHYNTLMKALIGLLVADSRTSLEAAWRFRFSSKESV